MVSNNFLPKINIRRYVKKIIILIIITYICMGAIFINKVHATQQKLEYSEAVVSKYPGYSQLIKEIQEKHPNWSFTILDTGLDWNEVIKNETVAVHGRNLIYYTNNGSWVCSKCGDRLYDSGRWKCASEASVAYYMDPRNWINENNIFQFENLAYNGSIQNIDGVNKILSNVPWACGSVIKYTKPDGTSGTLNKTYAQVIMEAAKEAGISPYHLAARIKQEQGTGGSASSTANGYYSGHVGYYNFLNIRATGSDIIGNALTYAQKQGWDDPEKSIKGGAKFIASDYISRGQSTLYLQKFDVDNSDGSLYYHQYMQNVSAALTEGNTVRNSYESMGLLDANINFVIPVYKNMPQDKSASPQGITIVTQNVKVTGNGVAVREGKGREYQEITKVNYGDILLRIEVSGIVEDGYYWDKIVLSDGRQGYIAREFIQQIDDVTNTEISAIANTAVNLRNGPGTSGTRIKLTLTSGQSVTIIETGKYNNIDGYNWSRVKLSNGTQGYLVSDYLTKMNSTNYLIAYVNCNLGGRVNVRSGVGTGNSVVTAVSKDTKVTVLQKNAGNANGYDWDKIVTSDGLEGYIANTYLKYDEQQNNNQSGNENQNNDKPNNEQPSDSNEEEQNEACDVDGNHNVDSSDLYCVIVFLKNNPDDYNKMYDVNKDGKVNSTDLYEIIVYLKQH